MSDQQRVLFPAEVAKRWANYEWEIIPATPQDSAMNLALDEVLTAEVGSGQRKPTLRMWQWASPNIVIGRFQSVTNEVNVEKAEELGIDVVRRISGGGAVLNEPEGAITYSIYTPPDFVDDLSFPESYAFYDSWVVGALRDLGIDAWYEPLNDITSSGGKIGGAAQARRFGAVLHHTTIAYDLTPGVLLQVLRVGEEKIRDKGIRSADRRVGPLRQQTEMPRQEIIDFLIDRFTNLTGATIGELTMDEVERAQRLVSEKFGTREWTHLLP